MKRKADQEELELEGGEKRLKMWNHGEHWLRGEMIGEGSFGSVFLATPKKPKRDEFKRTLNLPDVMAVKSAEVSDSDSIQHEAEVLFEIKGCPFVIERFGEETTTSEEGDHMVYNLLLEFASGGTLSDLIQRSNGHRLPECDVRRYTRCILEGIKHIHKCNFVHCDLKPDNILLVPTSTSGGGDASFVAKVADFGLAKRTGENYGPWRGTPMYLSPEALNDDEQDKPSDIWSLGCIVLEMLTGKSLWELKSCHDIDDFRYMVTFDYAFPDKILSKISGVARDFVKSCLAMRCCERSSAEKLLLHPFVAEPQASKAAPPTKVKVKAKARSVIVGRIPPPPGFELLAGL